MKSEIRGLKKLQLIMPDKNWVILTKKRILGANNVRQVEGAGLAGWFSNLEYTWRLALGRHSGLVAVLSTLVILLTTGVGFLTYQNQNLKGLLVELGPKDNSQNLTASLNNVQKSLEDINVALDNLEKTKSPDQVLAITEVVRVTASNGQEVISTIKHDSQSEIPKNVMASLDAVQKTSQALEAKSVAVQKDLLEDYIQDLKQRTLSAEDEERLQKVEEYYKQGKTSEALILLIRIGAK